jgi:UDP-2-acetamido-2,6-beta-L-arabino-hexul-4-ose reductase
MATVLVTGAAGFIGRNLTASLRRDPAMEVLTYDLEDEPEALENGLRRASIVFHLAGVNRPTSDEEFMSGNVGLTEDICSRLDQRKESPKVVFSSSIHAVQDTPYGVSKRMAEQRLQEYAKRSGGEVAAYRLPNVFGKWMRPNYNSVVATFCHNMMHGQPITISDPDRKLELVYVDDVVDAFRGEIASSAEGFASKRVAISHHVTLGGLARCLEAFRDSRRTLMLPDLSGAFERKLYATFLSYLEADRFAYDLVPRTDDRGVLAEFIKSSHFGQIFVSRTKPGITRGNHYHHTKTEKFLVLKGQAIVRLRHIERGEILEYPVRGRDFRVLDIPPGYTHAIENVGQDELIVLFWASEVFDPAQPDTYPLSVQGVGEASHEDCYHRRHAA